MTYFADLAPCTYVHDGEALRLRAIGWLSSQQPVSIGPVTSRFLDALSTSLESGLHKFAYHMGAHSCEFCGGSGAGRSRRDLPSGNGVYVIPGASRIYAFPKLIQHYVTVHGYAPPAEFCSALIDSVKLDPVAHYVRLLQLGGSAWEELLRQGASHDWSADESAMTPHQRDWYHEQVQHSRVLREALAMWEEQRRS